MGFERGRTSLSAALYARRLTDNGDFVTTPVSATSVVTRPENIGENVSGGLELIASARPSPRIDFSFTVNAFYSQLDAGNLGFSARRSAANVDGRPL